MLIFDQNQIRNSVHRTVKCKTFPQFACFIFALNAWGRLQSYWKCQDVEVWQKMGQILSQKIFSSENCGQNIW